MRTSRTQKQFTECGQNCEEGKQDEEQKTVSTTISGLRKSVEEATYTFHHSGENMQVKHKFAVGEVAWTKWNDRYSVVFINFQSQRLARETTFATSEVQYVPVYWVTFPCYSQRISHEYSTWIDEDLLIKGDHVGWEFCTRHNDGVINKGSKSCRTGDDGISANLANSVQQISNSNPPTPIKNTSVVPQRRYWFSFPKKLKKFLKTDKTMILDKKFLVLLPKDKNKTVNYIIQDFKNILLKVYHQIKNQHMDLLFQNSEFKLNLGRIDNQNGANTYINDFKEIYVRQVRWLDLFVCIFDIHFVGRGLYFLREEIEQIKGLLTDYPGMKMSDLMGVEHFVRFLDVRVLGNNFLSKIEVENEAVLNDCKNIMNLFLSYLACKLNDYTDPYQPH